MQGPATDRGVNYRALGELFDRANEDTSRSYKFRVSMLEVGYYTLLLCVQQYSMHEDIC
jgi:hypothetical protein